MILERITLSNFRCFESLELALDPHLNVFVGGNGSGKSTILQAIVLGLVPILEALPIDRPGKGLFSDPLLPELRATDIRIIEDDRPAPAAKLVVIARFETLIQRSWTLETTFQPPLYDSSRKESYQFQATQYCLELVRKHLADQAYVLPVFAYYGTDRSVSKSDGKGRDETLPQFFQRLAGMKDALNPVTDFQRATGWFDLLERRDLRQLRDSGGSAAYGAVRQAIGRMIDGIDNPRIDGATGRFVVDQMTAAGKRVKLFLDQLSDGYQVLLGVVMDFAIRLALASPPDWSAQAILESEAILIIDEVDLHLHPAWQQQVVERLRGTFPNTQIILTTHSPQVLSTVDARYIRQIARVDNSSTVTTPSYQTRGVGSATVLATALDVDPVPDVAEARKLSAYHALIAQGRYDTDDGRQLRAELDAHFGPSHQLIIDLDRLIRFREFKDRVAREKADHAPA